MVEEGEAGTLENPLDSYTRSILFQDRGKYSFSSQEKRDFERSSISFADHLMRLHGLKPPDKKIWRTFPYSGKGMLSILDILLRTIRSGHWVLMERRRVRENPQRPRIALLQDISGSIGNSGITRGTVLLCLALLELFGRGFAREFVLSTIGGSFTPVEYLRCQPKEGKRYILDQIYNKVGTMPSPVFETLERNRFFDGKLGKLIFVVTDGLCEVYRRGWKDESATLTEFSNLLRVITNQIENRTDTVLFWIQIGRYAKFEDFVKYALDYNPSTEPRNDKQRLGQTFYRFFQNQSFLFINFQQLMNGAIFHKLITYLFDRFRMKFT